MTRLSGEGVLESNVSGGGLEWVGGGSGQGGSPGQPGGHIWDIPLLALRSQITTWWGAMRGTQGTLHICRKPSMPGAG